jgi:DNA-binding NarL/FixJ family response regulator
MTATRILLADDHAMVRRGLRMVLDAEADLSVVAEAGSGSEALMAGLRETIDLAVLDVSMPCLSGLQAGAELARRRPTVRLLMLSMHDSEQYLYQALQAGASGYVLKSGADRDLVEACRAVMRGESFLYPSAITQLFRDLLADGRGPAELLTPREFQVIQLVAEAHTTEHIAALLNISRHTVERHRENIRAKLGIRDRVELTRYAIRRGLIEA